MPIQYEGHQLCTELTHGIRCVRAKKYLAGTLEEVCHEHVPAHRMSDDAAREALRSLVAHFSAWPGKYIVCSLLSRRRGDPRCYPGFQYHIAYPEPGAVRQYIARTEVHAWCDSVISNANLRPSGYR